MPTNHPFKTTMDPHTITRTITDATKHSEGVMKTALTKLAAVIPLPARAYIADRWGDLTIANVIGYLLARALPLALGGGIIYTSLQAIQHRTLGWGLAATAIDLAGVGVLFLLIPINNWASRQ